MDNMSTEPFEGNQGHATTESQLIQVCNMQIIFAAESDTMAIAVKHRIEEATRDLPKLRITFQLAAMPKRGENG